MMSNLTVALSGNVKPSQRTEEPPPRSKVSECYGNRFNVETANVLVMLVAKGNKVRDSKEFRLIFSLNTQLHNTQGLEQIHTNMSRPISISISLPSDTNKVVRYANIYLFQALSTTPCLLRATEMVYVQTFSRSRTCLGFLKFIGNKRDAQQCCI